MQYVFAVSFPRAFIAKIAVDVRIKRPASKIGILLCERTFNLVLAPKVKLALLTLAVGIYCRIERALRRSHLPSDKRKDFVCDSCVPVFPSSLKRLDISDPQERLVVQHLLEMGHQPLRVGRIAVEAKSYLLINAAQPHRLKRSFCHLKRFLTACAIPVSQEEREVVRRRELRRSPEPTM